jgi:SAM-dependent methyltransferase
MSAGVDFDQYSDSYREVLEGSIAFAGGDAARYIRAKARILAELASQRLGDSTRLEALDVGCGPGETDAYLEGTFAALHGVDVSAPMTERAAKRNPWARYSRYAEGDPLPYDDAAFDLAFAVCVFHHVPHNERPRLAAEMARVTRPGGLVVLFEHNPWNPLTRKAVRDCPFDEDAVLVSRREAVSLLDSAPLEPVESAYIIFFPRERPRLSRVERGLRWVPLGAQYYVAHRRKDHDG